MLQRKSSRSHGNSSPEPPRCAIARLCIYYPLSSVPWGDNGKMVTWCGALGRCGSDGSRGIKGDSTNKSYVLTEYWIPLWENYFFKPSKAKDDTSEVRCACLQHAQNGMFIFPMAYPFYLTSSPIVSSSTLQELTAIHFISCTVKKKKKKYARRFTSPSYEN